MGQGNSSTSSVTLTDTGMELRPTVPSDSQSAAVIT